MKICELYLYFIISFNDLKCKNNYAMHEYDVSNVLGTENTISFRI